MTDDGCVWEATLDRLDAAVRCAEALLKDPEHEHVPDFDVQRPATPLPRHLIPRAQELLHRQLRVQIQLARALEDCQRQLTYVERVAHAGRAASSSATRRSAYLDESA